MNGARGTTAQRSVVIPRIYLGCFFTIMHDEELDPVGSTVRYEMLCTGSAFGHLCLYMMNKVGIWRDVTDPLLTDLLTDLER